MKLRRGKGKQARRAQTRKNAPPVTEPQRDDLNDLSDDEIAEGLDKLDRLGFLVLLGLKLKRSAMPLTGAELTRKLSSGEPWTGSNA